MRSPSAERGAQKVQETLGLLRVVAAGSQIRDPRHLRTDPFRARRDVPVGLDQVCPFALEFGAHGGSVAQDGRGRKAAASRARPPQETTRGGADTSLP